MPYTPQETENLARQAAVEASLQAMQVTGSVLSEARASMPIDAPTGTTYTPQYDNNGEPIVQAEGRPWKVGMTLPIRL